MKTRKFSKVTAEITDELRPAIIDSDPLIDVILNEDDWILMLETIFKHL